MAISGNWMETDPIDMLGKPLKVNDKVARAEKFGQAVNIKVSTVTRIENGKVYLDGSKGALRFPGRLLVVNEVSGIH